MWWKHRAIYTALGNLSYFVLVEAAEISERQTCIFTEKHISNYQDIHVWAGEMAQGVKTVCYSLRELELVPSSYMAAHNSL